MVWFVFREDYYHAAKEPKLPEGASADAATEAKYNEWREEMERIHGLAELIVAKQRHGSTGKVRLRFESRITRFTDLADESMRYDSHE